VARGRRRREPVERRQADVLASDEFESLLEAASKLDGHKHRAQAIERAKQMRLLLEAQLTWKEIGARVGVAPTTAIYLHRCELPPPTTGWRRAIIATLGLAGLRVSELCQLEQRHVHLTARKIHVRAAKTERRRASHRQPTAAARGTQGVQRSPRRGRPGHASVRDPHRATPR